MNDLAKASTTELVTRLFDLSVILGEAWHEGLVDPEVAGIVRELLSRRTPMAMNALREIAPFWAEE